MPSYCGKAPCYFFEIFIVMHIYVIVMQINGIAMQTHAPLTLTSTFLLPLNLVLVVTLCYLQL